MTEASTNDRLGQPADVRALLDAIDLPQALVTPAGKIVVANATLARRLGLDAEQAAGRSLFEALPEPNAFEHRQRLEEAVRSGGRVIFEDEIDGRWYRHFFIPLAGPRGEIHQVATLCVDISGRVESESALRGCQAVRAVLLDSMRELCAFHELVTAADGRAVDYRVLDCNRAFSAITGIPRDEAVGALASALYGTGSAPFLDTYTEVVRTGRAARFEAYFAPMGIHFRILAVPIEGGFLTIADDVTAQRRVETETRERESSLRQIAEALPEALWIRDLATARVSYVSPGYERVWGRPCREMLTRPDSFLEWVHPEDRARVAEAVLALSSGRMTREEYRIVRKDRSVRWVRARSFPLVDSRGKHDRVAEIVQDVTELKHAEDGLRSMRALLDAVLEQCARRTGCELFAAVARLLAARVEHSYCFVGRLADGGERLQVLGFHGPEGPVGKYSSLAVVNTPCDRTIRQQFSFYPSRLQQLFPDAPLLTEIGAESYAGISLVGSAGRPLGNLAVLGTRPFEDDDREHLGFLLRLLALRASSEMERIAEDACGAETDAP